jgi:hypothetical protein
VDQGYHNPDKQELSEDFDLEAQRTARAAVMEIELFPDLTRALRKALGYGPHVDMLQHFCYWMHPDKPKMRKRWVMYKTRAEWYDECGLTERQVRKGRKVLLDRGLVTYKRGQYSRIQYRVDWVALADALDLDYCEDLLDDFMSDGNTVENESLNHEFMVDGSSVELHTRRHGVEPILDGNTVDLNARDYARDYVQKIQSYRSAEPAFAEPADEQMNGKKKYKFTVDANGKRTGVIEVTDEERSPTEDEKTPEAEVKRLYRTFYETEEGA